MTDEEADEYELQVAYEIAAINNIAYRGYFYDSETGLYYLQSRYYDPEVGRFINADDTAFIGYDGIPISSNIFVYCGNDPINFSDHLGCKSTKNYLSLKSDKAGRKLLSWYLYGNGKTRVLTDKFWSDYMKQNATLEYSVRKYIEKNLLNLKKSSRVYIKRTTSMVIDDGEDIIGYQYLHGTNSNYGGFIIEGTIKRDSNGNYTFSLTYTWNDYMDPGNFTTDQMKAYIGKIISFGQCKNYIVRIIWSDTSKRTSNGKWTSGWLK